MHLIVAMDVAKSASLAILFSVRGSAGTSHDVAFGNSQNSEMLLKPMPKPKPWALPMAKAHSPWKRVASTSNTLVVAVVVVVFKLFPLPTL